MSDVKRVGTVRDEARTSSCQSWKRSLKTSRVSPGLGVRLVVGALVVVEVRAEEAVQRLRAPRQEGEGHQETELCPPKGWHCSCPTSSNVHLFKHGWKTKLGPLCCCSEWKKKSIHARRLLIGLRKFEVENICSFYSIRFIRFSNERSNHRSSPIIAKKLIFAKIGVMVEPLLFKVTIATSFWCFEQWILRFNKNH